MKPAPRLDPKDIAYGHTGSASGASPVFCRADQVRSYTVTLTHRPTGVQVSATHGPDHLSKTRWREKRQELAAGMVGELERKVAQHVAAASKAARTTTHRHG